MDVFRVAPENNVDSRLTTHDSQLATGNSQLSTRDWRRREFPVFGDFDLSLLSTLLWRGCKGAGMQGQGVGGRGKRFIKAKRQMATATKKCCKQFAQWRRVLRKSLLPKHKDNNRGCPLPTPSCYSFIFHLPHSPPVAQLLLPLLSACT